MKEKNKYVFFKKIFSRDFGKTGLFFYKKEVKSYVLANFVPGTGGEGEWKRKRKWK